MTTAPNQDGTANKGKVLTLNNASQLASDSSQRPQSQRRLTFWLSFALCVLLPLALAASYYAAFATDRFAARAGFSIRGIDTNAGIDGIGALTGLASTGSTTSDSYIVLSYLGGRALLESVDERLDLRGVYSQSDVDWFSRLARDATVEDFVKYWNRRIHTQFDPTSGIIEFEIQSFSSEHAREIAESVLALTQTLVNELSANARQDALRFAREEVELQEARLREALAAIRDFRTSEQSVNPSASAALEIELIASLESRLIDVNARIDVLRQTLDDNAPSLVALQRTADALAAQIVERRQAIGSDLLDETGVSAVTQQLARYESLEVERSLAQQAYASALVSLEQARRDADRQQRYLAIHLRPQVAEAAEYPRSLRNVLIIAFALVSAWGIGTLITYSVRDHLT
jgi:capsular polysaccharide transport system permease protein